MYRVKKPLALVVGVVAGTSVVACSSGAAAPADAPDRISPKVMAVTLFGAEAQPWLDDRPLTTEIAVPGLSAEFPTVVCDGDDLCMVTTAMGYANAASSVAALVASDRFDLTNTYFVVSGIAGVDPEHGTLGSAHWAEYVVDAGLRHEIDQRQSPEDWASNVFALGTSQPGDSPGWGAGTEVYELNPDLVDAAFAATRDVDLTDNETAAAYRAHYPQQAASSAPFVSVCDTQSADTYWHGSLMAQDVGNWVGLLTEGRATYCTTQMEDNAVLTALTRGADAGLIDLDRVAVLRAGSNFDREYPGQSAVESIEAESGGLPIATRNAYLVSSTFADEIISAWDQWRDGVPTAE